MFTDLSIHKPVKMIEDFILIICLATALNFILAVVTSIALRESSFTAKVNIFDVVDAGFLRIFRNLRKVCKIDTYSVIGVSLKTLIDLAAYYFIFGVDGKKDVKILKEFAQVAIFTSPLLWACRFDLYAKMKRDLAVCLASSYFHGYLEKLGQHLSDSLKESVEPNDVPFPPVRLILIPRNGRIFDNLTDADPKIHFKTNSKSVHISYSGVHRRPYHCSLYEIATCDFKIRCCIEYVSALSVLSEFRDCWGFGLKDMEDIIMIFYKTLVEKLSLDANDACNLHLLLFSGEKGDLVNAIQERVLKDERLLQLVKYN